MSETLVADKTQAYCDSCSQPYHNIIQDCTINTTSTVIHASCNLLAVLQHKLLQSILHGMLLQMLRCVRLEAISMLQDGRQCNLVSKACRRS